MKISKSSLWLVLEDDDGIALKVVVVVVMDELEFSVCLHLWILKVLSLARCEVLLLLLLCILVNGYSFRVVKGFRTI